MDNNVSTQTEAANDQIDQTSAQFRGEPIRRIVTGDAPKPEQQEPVVATTVESQPPAAVIEPVVETQVQPDVFRKLKEAGYDLDSEEKIIEYLHSGRELQTKFTEYEKKAKDYESMDSLALDIDRAKKAGIDIDLYWDARKMEPEKLDVKEALRREFMLRNSQLVSDDVRFANMKFENDYKAKYGILDKKLDDAEKEEQAEQIEFAKRALDVDAKSAQRYLQEFKQKHVTIPEAQQQVQQGLSKEQSDQIVNQYFTQAEEYADSLEAIEISVGGKSFNYGLDNHKSQVKSELKDVVQTLRGIGVDIETGAIDAEKLGEFLIYPKIVADLKPVIDFAIEQRNAEIVTTRTTQPAPTQSLAGGNAGRQLTEEERLGEAFRARREAQRAVN